MILKLILKSSKIVTVKDLNKITSSNHDWASEDQLKPKVSHPSLKSIIKYFFTPTSYRHLESYNKIVPYFYCKKVIIMVGKVKQVFYPPPPRKKTRLD